MMMAAVAAVVAAVAGQGLVEAADNAMGRLTLTFITTVLIFATIAFGGPAEVQLKNGTSWKGEIGQTVSVEWAERGKIKKAEGEITTATTEYIVVEGEFIFIEDIISLSGSNDAQETTQHLAEVNDVMDTADDDTPKPARNDKAVAQEGELPSGVFVLPWKGMVGDSFRTTEFVRLIEHIETNYGLGQIIVIEVDSGGGAVSEWSDIRDVIFDAKERHRIIAWITQAGSGAAATAFTMDEIYYRSYGYLGSITMYSGDIENVANDQELYAWIKELQGVMAKSSWNPLVAGSMVKSIEAFSYDVDSVTGEVTYYDDTSGSNVLSRHDQNNMLNCEEAKHCGLSDGTADTGEELSKLLDLKEWIEIDQFGRELAADWWNTLEEWNDGKQDLFARCQGDVEGNTQKQRLSNQIKAIEQAIRWEKRLGETAGMASNGMLSKDGLIRLRGMILRLKQQLQYVED